MLRLCFLLAVARALQAPPRQRRATQLQAAEAVEVAADAFDQFGVAAVAASAKLASQDPAGEKPSDAQTRGVVLATAAAGAVDASRMAAMLEYESAARLTVLSRIWV